jgi:hypothetical protein
MEYIKYYRTLKTKFDHDSKVSLLRSSEDPELSCYMDWVGAKGSTDMDENGNVFVKINDAGDATKSTWLEELAHAIQFLKDGHIDLRCDQKQRAEREIEVADCLLCNSKKLKLSDDDIDNCQKSKEHYSQNL